MGNSKTKRRGFSLIWMMVGMSVFLGFASLSVDYGRVQLAKTQLRLAVDAAARAGVSSVALGPTAAQNQAIRIAALNSIDGVPLTLVANNDIELGTYNSSSGIFTALTGNAQYGATAVRVTGRRTVARGNPIDLVFSRLLGVNSKDLTVSSVATISSDNAMYVGMKLTRMFNTAHFDGYNSAAGPYSPSTAVAGKLYGNKDLWLHGTASVNGEAHWGENGALTKDSGATVSPGPLSQMHMSFSFLPVSLGNVATTNDNSRLTGGAYYDKNEIKAEKNKATQIAPGGTYYLDKIEIEEGATLLFNGPTVIYLDGDGKIDGTLAPASYRPAELTLKVTKKGKVHIEGGAFYGSIYAPESDVHHHKGGQSFGSVICNLLCFRQNSQGHADEALDFGNGTGGHIRTAK